MTTVRTIAKNTTVLFIATIISYILGFFINIYIARYLGAEGFGILSLALALTGIFAIFTELGLNTLTIRDIARDKSLKDNYVTNTAIIKVFLSFLTFGLIILTVNIIGYNSEVAYVIYIITVSIILGAFTSIFNSIFQALQKMEYMSIGNILNAVLLFAGVLWGIYFKLDIFFFAAIYLIANSLVLIYSFLVYIWKFSIPQININLSLWKPKLKEALPFGITNIFGSIYYWIDSVMLSIMVGNEVVGWYNAAYRLMFVFLSVYAVYMSSMFPVMSKFFKTSEEFLKLSYELSFKYLLIISIPIAVGTTLVADKVILLIYGNEFIPAILTLQILIWTIPFLFINGLSGNLLNSINKQVTIMKVTSIAAVINIILNLALIPRFSLIGSSVATVFTELVLLVILTHLLLKTDYLDWKAVIKVIPSILISNIIMIVFIIYLRDINLLELILMASIIYIIAIFLTKTIDKRDISIIKGILGR
jgi:O-antigen/teichoic acid export membrane protein